jgi:hypothetical protein
MKSFRPNDPITRGEAIKLLNATKSVGTAYSIALNTDRMTREDGAILLFDDLQTADI